MDASTETMQRDFFYWTEPELKNARLYWKANYSRKGRFEMGGLYEDVRQKLERYTSHETNVLEAYLSMHQLKQFIDEDVGGESTGAESPGVQTQSLKWRTTAFRSSYTRYEGG